MDRLKQLCPNCQLELLKIQLKPQNLDGLVTPPDPAIPFTLAMDDDAKLQMMGSTMLISQPLLH